MKILATKERGMIFFQHRAESTHYMHYPKSNQQAV